MLLELLVVEVHNMRFCCCDFLGTTMESEAGKSRAATAPISLERSVIQGKGSLLMIGIKCMDQERPHKRHMANGPENRTGHGRAC